MSVLLFRFSHNPTLAANDGINLIGPIDLVKVGSTNQLRSEMDEISRTLGFMVWERERESLGNQLSSKLRQQINARPFDPVLWRDLTFVNKIAPTSMRERAWVLSQAAALQKWNEPQRILLTHHCVEEYVEFQKTAPQLCDELLRELPEQPSLKTLADKMNVSLSKLRSALDAEDL